MVRLEIDKGLAVHYVFREEEVFAPAEAVQRSRCRETDSQMPPMSPVLRIDWRACSW